MKLTGAKSFFDSPSGTEPGDLQARESCEGLKTIGDHTLPLLPELERVCRGQVQKTSATSIRTLVPILADRRWLALS